jgi:pyrophosphatase PpaX
MTKADVCVLVGVKAVLFDLDGTIVDTNEIILSAMQDTLAHFTGRAWEHRELMPHWGMRLRDQLSALCPTLDLDAAVAFYRGRYAVYHETLLAEVPGTTAVLAALRARGLRLGVVTSKKRLNADQTLRDVGFLPIFAVVVTEEDTARHKPAPEPLLYALGALGLTADDAIYVGDNPDDIRAAHAAGMRGIAVAWSLRRCDELQAVAPTAIIETPGELLSLLSTGDTTRCCT